MLLKNAKVLLGAMVNGGLTCGTDSEYAFTGSDAYWAVKDIDGGIIGSNRSIDTGLFATTSTIWFRVVVGSGTTAPTEIDYNLESELSSGISISYATSNLVGTEPKRFITAVIKYSGSGSVTINEVGSETKLHASSSANEKWMLLTRDVLTVPLVLSPSNPVGVVQLVLGEELI